MRRWLRNQSIKRKLNAIVLVTSGAAVVLASALFLAYDYNSFRERMVTNLATIADGIGLLAYPALDAETADGAAGGVGTQARDQLGFIMGSLRAYPSIDHSVVFDANGRAIGGHNRNILVRPPTPEFQSHNSTAFTRDGLVLYRRVTTPDGRHVGLLYLLANTSELQARLQRYLGILAAVTLLSLLVSGLSTAFVFGALAISDQPALRAIGVTTGLGVLLAYALAPVMLVALGLRPRGGA